MPEEGRRLYGKKAKWYPGIIADVNEDGTFDIAFDDEEYNDGVPAEFIKLVRKKPSECN